MTPSRRGGLLDAIDDTTLTQVITNFSDRLLADDRLGPYLERVNVAQLRAHQRSFLLAALSGPELFNDLTLATAHLPLRLSDEDFDRAAAHMREWGVRVMPEEARGPLIGDVEIRRRGTFVGRSFYIMDPSGNRLELYSPTLPPEGAEQRQ